jgi:hypothetical protein
MKDKRLKTVHLFENELDLIVGDGEEKRLADLLKKAKGRRIFIWD